VRGLGTIALVLAGIWVLTQALVLVLVPLELLVLDDVGSRRLVTVPVMLLPALFAAGLGLVLILFRRPLARRLFEGHAPMARLDGRLLLRVGILVLALSALLGGIDVLLSALVRWGLFPAEVPAGQALRSVTPQLVEGASSIVLGALLLVFSDRLSRGLWRGRRSPPAPVPSEVAHCPACGATYDPADYEGGFFAPTCETCGAPLDIAGT